MDKKEEGWSGGQEPLSGAVCIRESRIGEGVRVP